MRVYIFIYRPTIISKRICANRLNSVTTFNRPISLHFDFWRKTMHNRKIRAKVSAIAEQRHLYKRGLRSSARGELVARRCRTLRTIKYGQRSAVSPSLIWSSWSTAVPLITLFYNYVHRYSSNRCMYLLICDKPFVTAVYGKRYQTVVAKNICTVVPCSRAKYGSNIRETDLMQARESRCDSCASCLRVMDVLKWNRISETYHIIVACFSYLLTYLLTYL